MRDAAAVRRALTTFGPALAILAVQLVLFPVPPGVFVRGLVVGGLTALIALGMALIYRSNRILNFAQPDLGSLPAVLVFMLMTAWGVPWIPSVLVGIASSLLLGAVVELAIIRRFRRAPRLLLTVATLGLAQLLTAAAILLPRLWDDERLIAPRIEPPFTLRFEIDPLVFSANDLLAAIVAPVAMVALYFFLQRTSLGTAIRASAESSDRASLLGIPVGRVQTLVWAVAALLAFTATFLRAGVLGLPVTTALGFGILLRALAALMLGRLTNLPAIATASVALGVLELGVGWNASSPLLIDPILAVVVVVGLVLRKPDRSRTEAADASSWQAADDVRPIPPELARLPEVKLTRWGIGLLVVGAVVILPNLLGAERSLKASAVLIYGILGLSLVVLTGWSGQVSLGTVAFFALGATLGAKATGDWGLDLTLALLLTAVAGALSAIVVGLPALRLRGLYLAVTTFAFALAATSYLLNRRFFDWIPTSRVERPPLLGRIDLNSPTRIYYVVLAGLVVVLVAVHGLRHSRTGRVLIALRENERAAQSFGISAVRARLTAFAASGAIAAFAGCLFVHHQQAIGEGPYQPFLNFVVFTMVVIGGIASVPGALLGALYLQGTYWFLPNEWQALASGLGVLAVLLVLPGGLGSLLYRLRDLWLRWVAARHEVDVPSMVADGGTEPMPEPVPAAVP